MFTYMEKKIEVYSTKIYASQKIHLHEPVGSMVVEILECCLKEVIQSGAGGGEEGLQGKDSH